VSLADQHTSYLRFASDPLQRLVPSRGPLASNNVVSKLSPGQHSPITKRMRTPVGFVRVNAELTGVRPLAMSIRALFVKKKTLIGGPPRRRNCDYATAGSYIEAGNPTSPLFVSCSLSAALRFNIRLAVRILKPKIPCLPLRASSQTFKELKPNKASNSFSAPKHFLPCQLPWLQETPSLSKAPTRRSSLREKCHARHPQLPAFVAKRLERAGLPALSTWKDARPVKKREQAPALQTLRDKVCRSTCPKD
jgi:hypothetical protein